MKRILIPTAILAITITAAIVIGLSVHHRHESQITKKAVDDLLVQFFHSGVNQRNIFTNLYGMGAKAWPAEIQALSQTGEIGSAAGLVLLNDRNAYKALPEFVRLLRDKNSMVRVQAATLIMAHLRPQDTFALPALIRALSDPNDSVRARSAQALGRLGPAAGKAVFALTKVLHDDSVFARIAAAESLASIDSNQDATVISVLKDAIANADDQNRYWAASALYKIAPKDPEILPVFINSLTNKQIVVRISAVYALRPYGSQASAAVPILLRMLKSNDVGTKETVRATLAKIDPEALASVSADEVAGSADAGGADLGPPPAGSQVIVLTNGTKLTLLGATTGTRQMAPGFENLRTANWIYTPSNTTVVWIEEEYKPGNEPLYDLLVSDKANTGCVDLEPRQGSFVRPGVSLQSFILSAYPRWDKETIIRVKPYMGVPSTEHFVLTNPPPRAVASWTPKPLPDTESDGDLEVTLTKLVAGAPTPSWRGGSLTPTNDPANQCVHLNFDFRQKGQPTTNWYPWPVQTTDASGNWSRGLIYPYPTNGVRRIWGHMKDGSYIPPPKHYGMDGYYFQPGLWPDRPWKVRLEFIQRSGFSDGEIVTFTNIPVKAGSKQDLNDEWDAWDIGRTNFPFKITEATVKGVHLKMLPPLLLSDQYSTGYPKDVSIIIGAGPNFNPKGMNLTVVAATDNQGRALWSFERPAWAGHYSIEFAGVHDDIKSLNLKLALCRDRFVEFTVKPEER